MSANLVANALRRFEGSIEQMKRWIAQPDEELCDK
jgi:hypothetical protein